MCSDASLYDLSQKPSPLYSWHVERADSIILEGKPAVSPLYVPSINYIEEMAVCTSKDFHLSL